MNIEISRNIGRNVRHELIRARDVTVQTTVLEDVDGVHETPLGTIGLKVLRRDQLARPSKIQLEGDVLRGSGAKHMNRRRTVRTIDLRSGWGAQNISKREVLIVRP